MNGHRNKASNSSGTFSREESSTANSQMNTPPGILRDERNPVPRKMNTDIPHILPHEKVFPIQIGSELFRLSGASLSSDAPSYFSEYFKCQLKQMEENGDANGNIRTLYIDRDPITFKDISLHLQGYHITPRDGNHFVKLFADAQFYSFPRLISQLYEEDIFICIGHRDFQIPRELFNDPGNSPNYFSLGFAIFFTTPTEVFPGLSREGLLRPPSILPPAVPNRSADTFSDLVHLLRGYPLHIRNEDHRAELLRDCRYFHLKGLEQKIIRHDISFNAIRNRKEIALRLEDVRQSGLSIVTDGPSSSSSPPHSAHSSSAIIQTSWINYARPFTDTTPYELLLEIGESATKLHFSPSPSNTVRAEFFGETKVRISKLFEVIATKLNLPTSQPLGLLMKKGGAGSQPASPGNTPISEDWVRVILGDDCAIQLDGREHFYERHSAGREDDSAASSVMGFEDFNIHDEERSRKRRRIDSGVVGGGGVSERESWIVKRALWRLRINGKRDERGRGLECVLVGVKIDAVTGESGRNRVRGFLDI